jgi:hypothetical protein
MTVCYWDMEIGTGETLSRLTHLAQDLGATIDPAYLRLQTLDDVVLSLKSPADLEHMAAELDRAHEETGRSVLAILDSADSLYGKEVWGKDADGFDAALKTLMVGRRDWLAVLVLCHTVKKPREGRANYVPDLQDVLGNLTRQADEVVLLDRKGPLTTRISTYKRAGRHNGILQRDEGRYAWTWTADVGDPSSKVAPTDVLAALRGRGRTTLSVLAADLGVSERTVRRYLDALEADGKIASTSEGTFKGRWEFWAIEP